MSDKIEKRFCTNCNKVTIFRLRKDQDIYEEEVDKIPFNAWKFVKCFAESIRIVTRDVLNDATFNKLNINKRWCCSKCGKE